MALTFPLTPNGLEVDVVVNWDAAALVPLWRAGCARRRFPVAR